MRVARARIFEVQGPLDGSAANANAVWRARRSLLLELTDEAGRTGQGEAAPLPGFSRESFDQVCSELVRVEWASLPERDPAVPASETIERAIEDQLDLAGLRAPAARFAAESALLDLAGQVAGKPIFQLLADTGSGDPKEAALPSRVALAALVSGDVLAAAPHRVARGYRHLKLKVGRSPAEDLALLASVRAELGPEIGLRADANGSLPPEALSAWLRSAAELELEFVEEPVPLGDLKALEGQKPSPVPLAIDESLSPGDETTFPAALEAGGYRFAVLKPSYHGGLLRCQRLARLARERGVQPVVSHLFEGPVALAGAAELALALAPCPPAGLAPHAGLERWPPIELPAFREAELVPHDAPGLGLPPLAELLAEESGERFKELRP